MQQGDVVLFQEYDGGNIAIEDGLVLMGGGLETAAYLSMFGGNKDDDGRFENNLSWWGNLDENIKTRQFRSETQFLLDTIVPVTSNLLRIEDAVKRDLAWLLSEKIASKITVMVSMPALNTIKITGKIEAIGLESSFEFVENWKAPS